MGKAINVTFLHPTNGQDMEVAIDDNMTASAVINELLACNFIPDNSELGADHSIRKGERWGFYSYYCRNGSGRC